MDKIQVNADRIWDRIQKIGCIGKDKDGGISRFAFSPEDRQAILLLKSWIEQIGLKFRQDSAGNVFGRIDAKGNEPTVLIGSHLDTVKNGGKFDGVTGVVAALEVCQLIVENNVKIDNSVELVVFVNEEGSRFPGGLMGSRAIIGQLDKNSLSDIKDKEGISLISSMKDYGANPDFIEEAALNKTELKIFFELHIEQAAYLEENNIPVGIVTGIAGPHQLELIIRGKSGHAGATPMKGRQDPLVAAALIIHEVEKSAIEASETTRGTVGYLKVYPGGHNIIPEKIHMTLDYRDINIYTREKAINRISDFINKITKKRNLEYELIDVLAKPPVIIKDEIIDLFKETANELKIPYLTMPSGAAHDAMIMDSIVNIGMIFIRSFKGLSHVPNEFSSKEDISLGTQILLNSVLKLIK